MPCYKPIEAWYSKSLNPTGKRSLVFNAKQALQPDAPIEIACGQCIGCRVERSRQWAVRCCHEASLYTVNSFVTLTFDNEHLHQREKPWSLDKSDLQKFMKRLRKFYFGSKKSDIRYYACGEYGDKNSRPHYHILLFNFDFPDKELFNISNGNRYYISEQLSKIWPYGFCIIGDVTYQSAAYVARYINKKITGDGAEDHYQAVDIETGEIYEVLPEFNLMSRRPAIGRDWFDTFSGDVYPSDFVVIDGKRHRPPKYYDKLFESLDAEHLEYIKDMRNIKAQRFNDENTRSRLDVREQVFARKIDKLVRPLGDNDNGNS
ncbi:MAG: replication initiator protein [Microviridae sp.]|nr:MAG: replication initiator protein [Microviridae sp.]